MTLPLVLAPRAEDDLEDAADFYEMQQFGLGEAFLRAVDAGFARIQRYPKVFRVDDLGGRTAFLHRFPYGVRFRMLDDRIETIAIWHERRDPDGWTERIEEGSS
jgi:plasmid stabilization system protein ParE